MRRPKPVLFAGFGLSLVIELSQLLNNRRTDIDDLILNTLGAALGYAQWRVMHLHAAPAGPRAGWAVPLGCLGAMCAGRLLLYHELWMASLLYGFCAPRQKPLPKRSGFVIYYGLEEEKVEEQDQDH